MKALDNRLLRVSIEIDGQVHVYKDLAITARGLKSGSFTQNECEISIANLDKNTRDFLLTEGSPYNRISNRKRKRIIVEAGRESYGYFVLYRGDISTVSVTQPPDITVVIKALTTQFSKGEIVARSGAGLSNVSTIAQGIASDLGVALSFNATDKQISNYTFTGSSESQVQKIYAMGDYDAYVDDDTLVVNDRLIALPNSTRILNIDTGLVGIPEFIDYGIKTRFFLDNKTKVGGLLQVSSKIYPASNGNYKIYKLEFDVANRETPFYYIAEARRI